MIELLKTIKVVGFRRIFRLYRAHQLGWVGIISGFYTTRTIQALLNVGFFDEMAAKGGVDLYEFAQQRNLDADILRSLCDTLFSLKILMRNHSIYSLDTKGQILVDTARGWFDGCYGYEEVFHLLEDMLRKEKVYGENLFRRPGFVAKGSGEAENLLYFPLAIDIISRRGFRKVLDLGCGDGTFLRRLCSQTKDVIGYGIDIAAEAVADGKQKANKDGLKDRIHLFVEDISKINDAPEPLQGIDVATVFFVLHEILFNSSDAVVELLTSFKKIFPGVPLIVFEVIKASPEELRKRPGMGVQYFLQHDLSHQKLVDRGEWKLLFEKAGFSLIEERYLRFARTAIFTIV